MENSNNVVVYFNSGTTESPKRQRIEIDLETQIITLPWEGAQSKSFEMEAVETPTLSQNDTKPSEVFSYDKILSAVSERVFDKVGFASRTYAVNASSINSLSDVVGFLNCLIAKETSVLHAKDKIQLCISHPNLTNPFYTSMTYVADFSLSTILDAIEKVVQSNQQFRIDNNTKIEWTTCVNPRAGTFKKAATLAEVFHKRCVVEIKNSDNLCAARAVVVGLASLSEDKTSSEYKNVIKGGTIQTARATELHRLSNVPLDSVGIDDIMKFEETIKHRIFIIDWCNGNSVFYEGNADHGNAVYLLKNGAHYHAITGINAYFGTSYWCLSCFQGYKDKNKHKCDTKCKLCKRADCASGTDIKNCIACNMDYYEGKCFKNAYNVRTV